MATGRRTVVVGQVIDPDTWGNPVWDQSVQTFASAADRTAQFPAPLAGAVTWLDDVKSLQVWDGTTWQPINLGKLAATIALDAALWVVDGANPMTLTRVGGRWLLTGWARNKNTGAFSQGSAPFGTVDATARVAGALTVRSAGWYTLPASGATIGAQIVPSTGVVTLYFPAAIASVSAGTLAVGFQLSWDATPIPVARPA